VEAKQTRIRCGFRVLGAGVNIMDIILTSGRVGQVVLSFVG
jgi:hypothetical protein